MGSMLEGDILAGHAQIVVVTFNYRLGIFGTSQYYSKAKKKSEGY